jgi:Flp pilus assembly protein TadD
MVLNEPSVDEQYAAAFRRWGLDVDGTSEDEVVERLGKEPQVVLQELIAALDAWMMERRRRGRPEAEWRRLFRVAEQLDQNKRHGRLRAWLVPPSPMRADTVAGFVATGSPWPALWQLARGNAWQGLLESRSEIQPGTAPVLTVLLLARGLAAVGDDAGAEEVLRQAATARPQQVMLLDALGKLLERQGPSRLQAAIGYYRTARGQRPQLGIALSRALLAANRATEAREVIQDLILRQPDNPGLYHWLGMVAYEQKKVGEAQAFFRKALDLNPKLSGAYYCLGIILVDQWRDDEAEAHYHKAIDLKPDFAEAYVNLGSILGRQGKFGEAEAAFRKAIELKPNLAEAPSGLGCLLLGRRKPSDAEAAFRKAIELEPNCASHYSNLGLALGRQRKYVEAEASCRKAIELQPDLAEAHTNLGQALYGQGKPAAAEAAFRKAIELQPDLAEAHCNLGAALLGWQRYREAEAALRTAIDLKPDYAEAFNNLAIALFRQKKPAAAEAAYRRAIVLQLISAEAYNDLGMALGQQGKHVEAKTAFRKAVDLQPNLVQAHVNLGSALMGQQKYAEAEVALRKAMDLKPDFVPPRVFLGQALMRQARFDEAAMVLRRLADSLGAQDTRRVKALQLLQRCQKFVILETRLPAILSGKEKPTNACERLDFAELCVGKRTTAPRRAFTATFSRRSPDSPTTRRRARVTSPPAPPHSRAAARARTQTSWTTENVPAGASKRSIGSARISPGGTRRWPTATRRPTLSSNCSYGNGGPMQPWQGFAAKTPSPGCRMRNVNRGRVSGRTWMRCSDA